MVKSGGRAARESRGSGVRSYVRQFCQTSVSALSQVVAQPFSFGHGQPLKRGCGPAARRGNYNLGDTKGTLQRPLADVNVLDTTVGHRNLVSEKDPAAQQNIVVFF